MSTSMRQSADYRRQGIGPTDACWRDRFWRESGSSLIEMLCVLTVLALLSVPVADALMQRLDASRQKDEARQMERIGAGLRRGVLVAKQVPSTNASSWSALAAAQIGITEDLVTFNRAGVARWLVYDPAFSLGGLGPSGLPFRQQSNGATNMTNARLVIISSLEPGAPAVDLNTVDGFSNLWNRAEGALPSGWTVGWPADPRNLVIQRVDLTDLFHEVTLSNVDGYSLAPFAVWTNRLGGVGFTNGIAVGSAPVSTRFIHGTPLLLHYRDGTPQATILVSEAASFVFEGGRWNRHTMTGRNGSSTCGLLGQYVEQFMYRANWTTTPNGTDPGSVILGMFDTLNGGIDWANAGFENENGNSKWEAPTARFLFDVTPQLMLGSWDLIE